MKPLTPKNYTVEGLKAHAEELCAEMNLQLTAEQKRYLVSEIRNALAPAAIILDIAAGSPLSAEELRDLKNSIHRVLAVVAEITK